MKQSLRYLLAFVMPLLCTVVVFVLAIKAQEETLPLLMLQSAVQTTTLTGYVDKSSCDFVEGWAADTKTLNAPVFVSLQFISLASPNTNATATQVANGFRGDVAAFLKDNGLHGFKIAIPNEWKAGIFKVKVFVVGSNFVLGGGSSIQLNCVATTPTTPPIVVPTIEPVNGSFNTGTGLLAVRPSPQGPYVVLVDGTVVPTFNSHLNGASCTIGQVDAQTPGEFWVCNRSQTLPKGTIGVWRKVALQQ